MPKKITNGNAKQPKSESMNYDFSDQVDCKGRMGANSFACMPENMILEEYSKQNQYLGGNERGTVNEIAETSGIKENWAKPLKHR